MSVATSDQSTLRQYISLSQAAKSLPNHGGQGVHIATLHRWCTHGVRGVRLRYVMVGIRRCTTAEWLNDFLESITEARERTLSGSAGRSVSSTDDAAKPTTAAARRARERAEAANARLEAAGY